MLRSALEGAAAFSFAEVPLLHRAGSGPRLARGPMRMSRRVGEGRPEARGQQIFALHPPRYRRADEALPKDAAETLQVGIHFGGFSRAWVSDAYWLIGAWHEMPGVIQPALLLAFQHCCSRTREDCFGTHEVKTGHAGCSSLMRRAPNLESCYASRQTPKQAVGVRGPFFSQEFLARGREWPLGET